MYFFLETDGFTNNRERARLKGMGVGRDAVKGGSEFGAPIRRPYRGIQVKENTYAVLSVRRPDGSPIYLTSSAAQVRTRDQTTIGAVADYADFILQRVDDQRVEKQQIIETFGDTFVYFFGERPRTVTLSGVLINTDDFNWRAEFWENYDKFFRGTKLVEQNARCYLAYDTIVLEGYPISATAVDSAEDPYTIPFQMTLLLTDYHEYSSIGQTRFTAAFTENLDILNQKLDKERKAFVSSSAEVRKMNLEARGAKGILATFRKGVRAYNDVMATATGLLDTASSLMAGRAVRLPIGAAGYLAQIGGAELTSDSIMTVSQGEFARATGGLSGTFGGVPIGFKVRMIGPARFAPTWVSEVTGKSRGMIWENYDEYPTRMQPESLKQLLSSKDWLALQSRQALAVSQAELEKAQAASINLLAESGGVLGNIADAVDFARNLFSMALTAANYLGDPIASVSAVLGLQPQDVTKIGEHLLRVSTGVGLFVGLDGQLTSAGRTFAAFAKNRFSDSAAALLGDESQSGKQNNNGPATLGEVYGEGSYLSSTSGLSEINYELVYGISDYSALVAQQKKKDEEALALASALSAGNEQATKSTLDEVYGDRDSPEDYGAAISTEEAPDTSGTATEIQSSASGEELATARRQMGTDIPPESLENVYSGRGTVQTITLTPEERVELLREAYKNVVRAPPEEDDISGIQSEEDANTRIDPII